MSAVIPTQAADAIRLGTTAFCAGRVLMGADNRGIQEQHARVRILQLLHDRAEHATLTPAIETLEDTVPIAEALGQITPRSAGLSNPQETIGKNADGRMELFNVDPSGTLWHCWQTAPNSAFSADRQSWSFMLGAVSFVATGTDTDGTLEVYAVGRNGGLYRATQSQPSSFFNEWSYLSGSY